ncbi:MAG: GspE/PulE family protein [Planctomycetota bacterium]
MPKFDLDDIMKTLNDPDPEPMKDAGGTSINPSVDQSIDRSIDRSVDQSVDQDLSGGMSVQPLFTPEKGDRAKDRPKLVTLLEQREVANSKQINAAQTLVKQSPGTSIGAALLSQGVDEEALQRCIAESCKLGFERIDTSLPEDQQYDGVLLQRLTPDFCKNNLVLPLRREDERVVLGLTDPEDVFLIDDVRRRLRARSMKLIVLMPSDISGVLEAMVGEAQDVDVESLLSDIEEDDVQVEKGESSEVDLEKEAGESPVIRYVNYIIHQAVKEGASDIHIEQGEKSVKVRFRIDGILFDMMQPPGKMGAALTSRLKIMANLDISERRLPQDGRIRCVVQGRKLDLRVSTLPSGVGEKTVMRILDTRSINVSLDDLGFGTDVLHIWKNQVSQPHGIVLVTGPTGSGKTTTLYASLRQMDKVTKNISTVEDPIEYHLDGITQTQTLEKIGMTFARALKALLRQDPDIIMIGEIRDQETAHTAVQAALTGHLVLSTLHTNDAPSAITRLVNIGLEPFLIGAAVNAVLAQRLVRRICPDCKREAQLTEEMSEFLEMQGIAASTVFEGEGCAKCRGTGHAGRVGIYELLVVDDMLRDIVARNPNVTEFRRTCVDRGMVTLRQDGFNKVERGLTTVQEILRVTEATI